MNKRFLFCILGMILTLPAYADGASGSGGSAITTQTYVDNLLNTKQAKFTTTGTNKLMTYGASAGATPGSRDIVTALGTSTTATTVPETGPIVTGINSKQNAVNGTADYVMTGTGTAGTVGEKPVYSTTNNYDIALVEAATVNTAAATAANSELTCIDNDCLLWQINTSGPAGISTRIYLDPSINGISNCYRSLDGTTNSNGTKGQISCSNDTLSLIGATGSKSGRWGIVFSYGEITGMGVCSTQRTGSVATDAQQTILDNEFNSQSGTGNVTSSQSQCWCKMDGPAVSKWVRYGADSTCAKTCAGNCSYRARIGDQNIRQRMFNNLI